MKKAFKVVLPILAMAIGIFLLASPAEASFWLKGAGFHYSPDYGSLGDGLEKVKPYYETPEKLEPGTGVAFSAGWDLEIQPDPVVVGPSLIDFIPELKRGVNDK